MVLNSPQIFIKKYAIWSLLNFLSTDMQTIVIGRELSIQINPFLEVISLLHWHRVILWKPTSLPSEHLVFHSYTNIVVFHRKSTCTPILWISLSLPVTILGFYWGLQTTEQGHDLGHPVGDPLATDMLEVWEKYCN